MDPDAVADAMAGPFAKNFYEMFDANVEGLRYLYGEDSMLTFEGERFQGMERILNKLVSLPFQQCRHRINTVDGQPAGPARGVIVLVRGVLDFVGLDGELHAHDFSQTFQLMPTPQGGFYILNDLFRVGQAALYSQVAVGE